MRRCPACARSSRARSRSSVAAVGVQVGEQWRLRVDDDATPAGQSHDEIGTHPPRIAVAVLAVRRDLRLEVAVLGHPRELDDALELHLAPPSAHVRRAERRGELLRLVAQSVARRGHEIEPRGERAELRRALAVERGEPRVVALELDAKRREQLGEPRGRRRLVAAALSAEQERRCRARR